MRIVREASKFDLDEIERWLSFEYNKYNEGFWCNWSVIKDCFKRKLLFVCVKNNVPIGFIAGTLSNPLILNVKIGHRSNGVGKKLFKYILKKAEKNRVSVIKVDCKPSESIGFWKKMGFKIKDGCGYRILEYINRINLGQESEVFINSYHEEKLYNVNSEPINTQKVLGRLDENKTISFKKRVTLLNTGLSVGEDLVVMIKVNGSEIYCDKAKRDAEKHNKNEKVGIKKLDYDMGYYLDYLVLKNKI